jgi:hypothetical protein
MPAWRYDQNTCAAATSGGHLEILQWLRGQDPPAPWDTDECVYATENGHLNVLQWLRVQDEFTCVYSAKNGHLYVLQWLCNHNPAASLDTKAYAYAAKNGHLDMCCSGCVVNILSHI